MLQWEYAPTVWLFVDGMSFLLWTDLIRSLLTDSAAAHGEASGCFKMVHIC